MGRFDSMWVWLYYESCYYCWQMSRYEDAAALSVTSLLVLCCNWLTSLSLGYSVVVFSVNTAISREDLSGLQTNLNAHIWYAVVVSVT